MCPFNTRAIGSNIKTIVENHRFVTYPDWEYLCFKPQIYRDCGAPWRVIKETRLRIANYKSR